ncbi:MAG: hypothetical protein AAGD32_13425 [Planctomycetota bacterium]
MHIDLDLGPLCVFKSQQEDLDRVIAELTDAHDGVRGISSGLQWVKPDDDLTNLAVRLQITEAFRQDLVALIRTPKALFSKCVEVFVKLQRQPVSTQLRHLAKLLPKKHRESLVCDLMDDLDELESAGSSRWWQWCVAVSQVLFAALRIGVIAALAKWAFGVIREMFRFPGS